MKEAEKIRGISFQSPLRGKSRGGYTANITWWWNDEVKKAIKEKRLLYKKWQKDRHQTLREQYRIKKNGSKSSCGHSKRKDGAQNCQAV